MIFYKKKLGNKQQDFFCLFTLSIIIIIAFIFRISSIRFGYPLIIHADEHFLVDTALRIIKTGDLNPHFFNYPSLVIYIQTLLYKCMCIFYQLAYDINIDDIPKINFHIAGRALASFASILSIILLFKIGKRIKSTEAGIVAAGIIAVMPIHIENSIFVTTDIWVAIFTTFVLYYAIKIYESGRTNDYIIAGIFVGLSMGSKYTAAVSFISIFVAHSLLCHKNNTQILSRKILLSSFLAGIVFIASTPYSVMDIRHFLGGILSESRHYRNGHIGHEAIGNYSFKLYFDTIISNDCLGYIASFMTLTSPLFLFKNKNIYILIILAFPIVFFLMLGSHKVFFTRNIIAIMPSLALLSGLTLHYIIKNIGFVNKNRNYSRITLLIAILLLTINLFKKSYSDLIIRGLPDTRWVAIEWIKNNIPPGSKIVREQYTPPVEDYIKPYNVTLLGMYGLNNKESKIDASTSYIILSSYEYGRFFDGKEKYKAEAKVYSDFFMNHKLVYEISPDNVNYTGPTIKVFLNH